MHVLSVEKPLLIDIQGTSLCQKGCNNTPSSAKYTCYELHPTDRVEMVQRGGGSANGRPILQATLLPSQSYDFSRRLPKFSLQFNGFNSCRIAAEALKTGTLCQRSLKPIHPTPLILKK